MRYSGGWVKLHRSVFEKELTQNIYLWGIWSWLLVAASWKPSKILRAGKQVEVPAGTVVFGLKELSEQFQCSRTTILKWVKYLHDTGRIVYEPLTVGCVATICNWETYQSTEDEPLTPSEHEVNTKCTPSGTYKEVKKKEKRNTTPESGSPLQCSVVFSSLVETLKKRGVSQDLYDRWIEAFPESEWIVEQINMALAWEVANPKNYKKNFGRFVTNWMSRNWDKRKSAKAQRPVRNVDLNLNEEKEAL